MNPSSNIPSTLLKSSLLATLIFWGLIIAEGFNIEVIPFIIASIIPISIICSLTIMITIVPFYYIEENYMSNRKIFKKYFPYYSISIFGICSYCIVSLNFESFVCIFFITAFFTLMQSWIWIYKTPTTKKEKEKL
ncbi:MAG: hypothetical protein JXR05_06295 [Flavobacteriaceae bacterium]